MKSLLFFLFNLIFSFFFFVFLVGTTLVFCNKKNVIFKYFFFYYIWFFNLDFWISQFLNFRKKIITVNGVVIFYGMYMLSLNIFYLFFNQMFFFLWFSLNNKIVDLDYVNYFLHYQLIDFFYFFKFIVDFLIFLHTPFVSFPILW